MSAQRTVALLNCGDSTRAADLARRRGRLDPAASPRRFLLHLPTRPIFHTDPPNADRPGTGLSGRSRLFGHLGSSQRRSRTGTRSEQASLGGAVALVLVPLLGILLLAVLGLGSAFGLANPFFGPPSRTSGYEGVNQADAPSGADLSEADRSVQLPGDDTRGYTGAVATTTSDSGPEVLVSAQSTAEPIAAPAPASVSAAKPKAVTSTAAAASLVAAAAFQSPRTRGTITIETFGYLFDGPPEECRFVADVRNINVDGFTQADTGLMQWVRDRVMATSEAQAWLAIMRTRWMSSLRDGDTVAIGCARGHHRSVTLAVIFAEDLRAQGYTVNLVHRDILKTW